eukprot:4066316-Pyramimonas_sp.AAC.1
MGPRPSSLGFTFASPSPLRILGPAGAGGFNMVSRQALELRALLTPWSLQSMPPCGGAQSVAFAP